MSDKEDDPKPDGTSVDVVSPYDLNTLEPSHYNTQTAKMGDAEYSSLPISEENSIVPTNNNREEEIEEGVTEGTNAKPDVTKTDSTNGMGENIILSEFPTVLNPPFPEEEPSPEVKEIREPIEEAIVPPEFPGVQDPPFPETEPTPDVVKAREPIQEVYIPPEFPIIQNPPFPETEPTPEVVEVREPIEETTKENNDLTELEDPPAPISLISPVMPVTSYPVHLDPSVEEGRHSPEEKQYLVDSESTNGKSPIIYPELTPTGDSKSAHTSVEEREVVEKDYTDDLKQIQQENPIRESNPHYLKSNRRPPKSPRGDSQDKLFEIPNESNPYQVSSFGKPPAPKKQVSILVNRPPSDEDIPMHKRMMEPLDTDEKTPLLSCSSLPTVVGIDELRVHPEQSTSYAYDNPISSTRSEGGHPQPRRKHKRRRYRSEIDRDITKLRPLIASPFMPITTQKALDSDRKSLVGSVPRARSVRGQSYGSIKKTAEAPLLTQESSESDEEESDSDTSSTESPPSKTTFASLTSRGWITVVMLAVANLASTVAFSCIAPFYPQEANLKGMTESETGIVFGVFELAMFVTAPLFGKYMTHIGSKNMFTLGLAITGITAICFGFLNFLPSGRLFFWASLIIRVAEAIGDAAFVTSSFAISAKCFPGSIASVVGIMETFAGLGYTAGPLIGGFLYEYGGFQTPFLVLGGCLLIATGLSMCLIEAPEDEQTDQDDQKGMLAMLRIPVIWIMVYAVVVCAISLSFLDPTLEAHLRSFNLSPTMVGLMFLLCGGIYTLSAPFWGILIDKWHCSTAIMLFGSVATAISMILIGPTPLLPFEKNLIVIGIALSVLGVAAGALYIPTFQNCLDSVKEHGFEDNIYTYGCVSGVFQSAFAFGGFIGPTLGGAIVQWVGFSWTTTAIAGVNVIFIITLCAFTLTKSLRKPPTAPLILLDNTA